MSDQELVSYEVHDGIGVLTMNSPDNRNALSASLRTRLITVLTRASESPHVRVILLTHTGTAFSSGMDVRGASFEQGLRDLAQILTLITQAPKPVVARVGGTVRAGGIGLLAAADITLASDAATFAFSEVRLGVIPAVISVPVLARVAPAAARELFLTGHVFEAARAKEIGLVDALAQGANQLDRRVDQAIASLLRGAPGALARTKALLNAAQGADEWPRRYEELVAESVAGFASDEGKEGLAAFREKRSPTWMLPKPR